MKSRPTNGHRLNGLVLEAQRDLFRLARRDHDLTQAEISRRSSIHPNSIKGYANGNHAMPIVAVLMLVGIVPDYLLSHLFAPVEKQLGESQIEFFIPEQEAAE